MAVSCQFLSTDWGNVADWGAVVAALVVGYAVIRVSKRTNKLADAANETSRAMASLVRQQATDAEALRRREQQLLLVSLAAPVARYGNILKSLARALEHDAIRKDAINDAKMQGHLIEAIRRNALTIPDGVRDRMHYLDIGLAASILRAEGSPALLIEGLTNLNVADENIRTEGIAIVKRAMEVQHNELEPARAACYLACKEAGLKIEIRDPIAEVPQEQPRPV